MNKKTRIVIPFSLTSIALIYCWAMLFTNDYIPSWKHYSALILLAVVFLFFIKKWITGLVLALGVYLCLASLHIISFSYDQATLVFGPNIPFNPHFQLMSLGIFIVYIFLNLDQLIEIQLDWKESKVLQQREQSV